MRLEGSKSRYDHKIPGERKREKKRAKILRFKGGQLEGAYKSYLFYSCNYYKQRGFWWLERERERKSRAPGIRYM